MEKYFINHTNHQSSRWSAEQISAAEVFGKILDVPFPNISPSADKNAVLELVKANLERILALKPAAVLCQGEFNYTFEMVTQLKNISVPVMAATSERVVSEEILPDGSTKNVSTFRFVRFREY